MRSNMHEPHVISAGTMPLSSTTRWAGRILSAIPVVLLILDGVVKVLNLQPVLDASILLGLPVDLAPGIGILLLVCLAIYLLPRTSVLGAILLTGYLGGAIALQLRIGADVIRRVIMYQS
jgi:hypothetical protein